MQDEMMENEESKITSGFRIKRITKYEFLSLLFFGVLRGILQFLAIAANENDSKRSIKQINCYRWHRFR